MRSIIAATTISFLIMSSHSHCDEPKTPAEKRIEAANEKIAIANDKYERELAEAARAFKTAAENARKRMRKAYDDQIASLDRKGAAEFQLQNKLAADKETFESEAADDAKVGSATPSPKQDEVLRLLKSNDWLMYWDNDPSNNSVTPGKFYANGTNSTDPSKGEKWSLERRWVLNYSGHLLILQEDQKLWRGFFVPSGRHVTLVKSKQ